MELVIKWKCLKGDSTQARKLSQTAKWACQYKQSIGSMAQQMTECVYINGLQYTNRLATLYLEVTGKWKRSQTCLDWTSFAVKS